MKMTARLAGGTFHNGSFDVPEPVEAELVAEMKRLQRSISTLSFERGGTHVHDRGHRLVEYRAKSPRVDVDVVADYLDSLGYHLYAAYRGLDASRWPVKALDM